MLVSRKRNAAAQRGTQAQMDPFDSMDRKLFAGAIVLARYVVLKSLGLL